MRAIGISIGLVLPLTAAAAEPAAPPVKTLRMEEALQELEKQSPSLAQASSRAAEAAAVVQQAWAPLLPTVVVNGGYIRNSDQVALSLPPSLAATLPSGALKNGIVIQPLSVWTVSGAIRVPLLAPQAWADLAAARQGAEAAKAATAAARLQLRAALAQAAWANAFAEEVVAASERAVQIAGEHRDAARRAVDAGTAAPLSVLKAETEVVKRQSDLARARSETGRAQLALGVLLGRSEPLRVPPLEAQTPKADARSLASEALERRPELRATAAQIESSRAQEQSAKLRLLPQLSGSFAAFAQTVKLPTDRYEGWRATLDLTWPLFDGGFRYGKLHQAEAAEAGARASLEAQRLGIVQEVQDAIREIAVARERLRLARQQHDFATEAQASARRTFEAGVGSSLEVLDANDRLYQADVAVADARSRLGMAEVALTRAIGR